MMQSKPHNDGRQSSQQGFTIIESLVAILVVTILLIAISPVIVLSIGVRLQAKRVDSATRAARFYIDGVKSGEIVPPEHTVLLQEADIVTTSTTTTTVFNADRGAFVAASPPTTGTLNCTAGSALGYCNNDPTNPYSLYCVDGDDADSQCTADSNKDLIVQAFRSIHSTTANIDSGYLLGVRVYRADGFSDNDELKINEQQLSASGGLGDRKVPLVEITTEVVNSNTSLGGYCQRFGGCQ